MYLPICTSSPSSSFALSTRRRFTYVPLRLPSSSIVKPSAAVCDHGVAARDGDVVEEDVALGRAPERGAVALEGERLARRARRRSGRRAPAPRSAARRATSRRPRSSSGVKVMSCGRRPAPRGSAARRTSRSSAQPRGSGSRTRGSGRRSLLGRVELLVRRGRRLRGEDRRQLVDVDLVQRALLLPHLLLEARLELGSEDVDLAVEEPALVGDLVLFGP